MSGDIMTVIQDFVPVVIPNEKRHMNMGPILNGYGAMDISCRNFCPNARTDMVSRKPTHY
jgi:hypothetical protein